MQTVIQVIATGRGSLRSQITRDPQLEKKFGFIKAWSKQPGRPHGWAKIHSAHDLHGAIKAGFSPSTSCGDRDKASKALTLLYKRRPRCIRRAPKFRINGIVAIHSGYKKKQTDIFVCDNCGARKRLERNKRQWWDNCTHRNPIELRRAKDKKLTLSLGRALNRAELAL